MYGIPAEKIGEVMCLSSLAGLWILLFLLLVATKEDWLFIGRVFLSLGILVAILGGAMFFQSRASPEQIGETICYSYFVIKALLLLFLLTKPRRGKYL